MIKQHSQWKSYAVAIGSSLIVVAVLAWMEHAWQQDPPVVIAVLAVIVSAYYGGFAPAMLATGLCLVASWLLIATPRYSFHIADPGDRVRLIGFFLIGLVISTIGESLRRWRDQSAYERLGRIEAERAKLETQKAATERLRKILDTAYDAFVAMSTDGAISDWNPKAETMFGWARGEALGKPLVDLIIPVQYRDAHNRGLRSYLETGQGPVLGNRLEISAVRRDGSEFPIELTISAIGSGPDRFFAAFIHDITERRTAAEQIVRLSRANQAILDFAGEGIYGLDTEGHTTFMNPAGMRMTGWTSEELKGKLQHAIMHHTKADGSPYPVEECPIYAALKGGSVRHVSDEVFWRKDGTSFPVEYTSTPIRSEDGASSGAVVVFRDITERREAEQAMAEQQRELERSNAELQQFAYVASHDLQEPLRMVASYTQLLAKRYKGKLGDDADEFIHYAVDGAQRMQGLINDLLMYSRVGTRGKPFEKIDLNEIVRIALANLKVAIEEGQATIDAGPLPTLTGDRSQLAQLFQNLIGNAIKFRAPDRPVRVTISAERVATVAAPVGDATPAVSHATPSAFTAASSSAKNSSEPGTSATETAAAWKFTISDNGIGIAAEHFDRIFVIFQRLHTRDNYPGTGIGLAICRKIVERHGGKLWVNSEQGEGSSFLFTLPDREEDDEPAPQTGGAGA